MLKLENALGSRVLFVALEPVKFLGFGSQFKVCVLQKIAYSTQINVLKSVFICSFTLPKVYCTLTEFPNDS